MREARTRQRPCRPQLQSDWDDVQSKLESRFHHLLAGCGYARLRTVSGRFAHQHENPSISGGSIHVVESRKHALPPNTAKFCRRQVLAEKLILARIDQVTECLNIHGASVPC